MDRDETWQECSSSIAYASIDGVRFLQRVSIACYAKRCTSYRKSV